MSSQRGPLSKIRANLSSFADIRLFTEILFLVTVLPIMLKLLSLSKLMKVLTPRDLEVYTNRDSEKSKQKVVKFTNYVMGWNFWIYKRTCLRRSLVLYYFLRKFGIDVHLCFGVRNSESLPDIRTRAKLEGHAWLVYNGDVFLERNSKATKNYKITFCFPEMTEPISEETVLRQS